MLPEELEAYLVAIGEPRFRARQLFSWLGKGAASFDVEAGTYTIHILKVPEGYAEDAEEYTAPETPGTVEITLNKS